MEEKQNKPRKDFKSKGKFGGKKFGEKSNSWTASSAWAS